MAIFTFLILRRGTKQGKTRRAGMMFFAVLTIIVAWCFVVLIIGLGFALHQGGKYYMEPTPVTSFLSKHVQVQAHSIQL